MRARSPKRKTAKVKGRSHRRPVGKAKRTEAPAPMAVKRLTHDERKQRRREIAAFVKKGGAMSAAAEEFNVSLATIKGACAEFGVEWPAGKRGPKQRIV